MNRPLPELSVIVCSHNPDPIRLQKALEAIACQSAPPVYELILVDNRSDPPLSESVFCPSDAISQSVLREPRLGLANARQTAIAAAQAPLLCFVDDDNYLCTNYLRTAVEIAHEEQDLGAFGGQSIGDFDIQPDWLCRHFLARYAIRCDPNPLTLAAPSRKLRGYEPFGAGMVVRRPIARGFAALHSNLRTAAQLGRVGEELGSGEDSMFSRVAFRLGYKVGYRPQLVLKHAIGAGRFRWDYLRRLIEGQAKAEAILDAFDGIELESAPRPNQLGIVDRSARFLRRVRSVNLAEAYGLNFWDTAYAGYIESARDIAAELRAICQELPQLISDVSDPPEIR